MYIVCYIVLVVERTCVLLQAMASSRPLVGLVPKRTGLYIGKIIRPFEVPNYYTMYYNPKVEENVKKKKMSTSLCYFCSHIQLKGKLYYFCNYILISSIYSLITY